MPRPKREPLPPEPPGDFAPWDDSVDSDHDDDRDRDQEVEDRTGEARRGRERQSDAEDDALFDQFDDIEAHLLDSDSPLAGAALDNEVVRRRKVRREEERLSPDPSVWLAANKMTRTETALRLALYLVSQKHVTSDVTMAITGHELTRWGRPRFPVVAYLGQHGWHPTTQDDEWRATYGKSNTAHALTLTDKRGAWDLAAQVAPDARILALAGAGILGETRSRAEQGTVPLLIGRAMARRDMDAMDFLVVAVPRSERLRKIAGDVRQAPRVMRAGVSVCTVDRAGLVTGLPFLDASAGEN